VGYASLGIDLKYLVAASFMAAPGGLLMAKLIMLEQGTAIESVDDNEENDDDKPINVIDAAAIGATVGIKLAVNVGGMLLAFLGLIALMNGFANLSAIAILVGGLGAIAPNRRHDLARLGFKAIIAGSLSNLMSATLAGIFISLV
jgi:CNT family concentrative nucleoside transporter